MRTKKPIDYPKTKASAESGRQIMRGEKEVALTIKGKRFVYKQPG